MFLEGSNPYFFIKEVACVLCSIFGENKKALNLLEFAGILRAANWGDPLIIAKKIFSTFVCIEQAHRQNGARKLMSISWTGH